MKGAFPDSLRSSPAIVAPGGRLNGVDTRVGSDTGLGGTVATMVAVAMGSVAAPAQATKIIANVRMSGIFNNRISILPPILDGIRMCFFTGSGSLHSSVRRSHKQDEGYVGLHNRHLPGSAWLIGHDKGGINIFQCITIPVEGQ